MKSVWFGLAICFFGISAHAADGSCVARRGNPGYQAYCDSFDETPCRMNNNVCRWIPEVSDQGTCQPRDEGNPAYAAYCENFDETACRMNNNVCRWW